MSDYLLKTNHYLLDLGADDDLDSNHANEQKMNKTITSGTYCRVLLTKHLLEISKQYNSAECSRIEQLRHNNLPHSINTFTHMYSLT